MKVTVDQDVCASSGNCVMNAPELFDQRDDDGVVVLLNPSPSPSRPMASAERRLPAPPWPSTSRNEMPEALTSTGISASDPEIPDYPMPRLASCPFAPPPDVMALAAASPLSRVRIWDGSTPWLITGYEQVRELFSDSRVSVDDRVPGFPHWNAGMLATVHKRPRSVFTADGEEHTRFRRMLSKPFTFKRVEGLRAFIQQITDEHIDAMLAGPRPRTSSPPSRCRSRRW